MKKCIYFLTLALLTTFCLVAAPQAVVFDFGGVLTADANRQLVVDFLKETFQLSEKELDSVRKQRHQAVESGQSDEEFWLEFAKKKGIGLPDHFSESFHKVILEAIGVIPEMYALIDELKEKSIPVALLSNIDDRLAKLIRSFGLYSPFEPCLLSCELGVKKPDPQIYHILVQRMGHPAQNIVFIDDKQENVDAAKALGIDAIVFTSPAQIREELRKRGLDTKPKK